MVLLVFVGLIKLYGSSQYAKGNSPKPCTEAFLAQQYDKAIEICSKLSEKGIEGASLMLGKIYADGIATAKNFEKAKSLYLKEAISGNAEISNLAKTSLGDLYKDKEFSESDMEQAFKWYKSAADSGHSQAQLSLGAMLLLGQGTDQNVELARAYLIKASKNGEEKADEILLALDKETEKTNQPTDDVKE